MSVEKIGNVEQGMGVNQKVAAHKVQKPVVTQQDAVVHDKGKDLTRISYPPFLPIGDTQSIYKK